MTSLIQVPKKLIVLSIVLPLAAILGYFMATPDQFDSLAVVALCIGVLTLPLVLRWHHTMLILALNSTAALVLFPGQPALWIALAGLSWGISIIERGLSKKQSETFVPSVVWPLLLLTAVVVVTAKLRGGFGVTALGGNAFGAKRYFFVLAAVIAYFALTSQRITSAKARGLLKGYFASALVPMVSNLIYMLGPAFYFLYWFFPVDMVYQQVAGEYAFATGGMTRWTGFAFGGAAMVYVMIVVYGIKGIFSLAHAWRLVALTAFFGLALLGGFRSSVLMISAFLFIQFFLEGLHKTRLSLYLGLVLVLAACLLVPFASSLPLSMQRSLSFLPIELSPIARYDAQDSVDWRLQMWRIVWPQVPNYLLLGKGCSVDATEMWLIHQGNLMGLYKDYEESLYIGGYHNGPLTLLIQFGAFGALAFLWFAYASLRVIYHHYRNSPPELRLLNSVLLSYFATRLIYFLFFYGHFTDDLYLFTGIIGLSVSINGNLKQPTMAKAQELAEPKPDFNSGPLVRPEGAV